MGEKEPAKENSNMPIEVYWDDDDHTIIRSEGEGNWTWEDYHEALALIIQMMNSVEQRVDLINIALPGSATPRGSSLPHFRRALRLMPDHFGMNVVVSDTSFGQLLVNMFSKVYATRIGADIRMAVSLEDARLIIALDRAAKFDPGEPTDPTDDTQDSV